MWKYAGYENRTPSIPLYEFGENFDFTMTFENETTATFSNAYLYVEPRHLGMVSVKFPDEPVTAYRDVKTCLDANAFLGDIPVGTIELDLRINNSSVEGTINLYIQVYLAHSDGATLPVAGFSRSYSELFKTCYDRVIFWKTDYTVSEGTTCTPRISPSEGFSDSLEPQQFEDSTSGQFD